MTPPLVLDIDGTLTRPDDPPRSRGLDPRVFDPIREWSAPVVIATGKSFPYPVALCSFIGIEERVVAENGGVVYADDEVVVTGDPEAAWAVADAYREMGYDLGFGEVDTANRWRETEIIVSVDRPEEPLRDLANKHGQEVVDTGYAYHVKSPDVSKGLGLEAIADILDLDAADFVAVGDSENDVSTFEVVDRSFAVANADDAARAAADTVTDGAHADGLLEALDAVR